MEMSSPASTEFGAFLRASRQGLRPADVGLAEGRRRRTPGLRREEVAELADIGTSWYTALEQGRRGRPSDAVIGRLAKALRLTQAETGHLFALANRVPPDPGATDPPAVPDAVRLLLSALEPNPAYVADRLWNTLAWNRAASALFRIDAAETERDRNRLWRFFHAPFSEGDTEKENSARAMVASFRVEWAKTPAHPALKSLLDDLIGHSAAFARLWAQHEVRDVEEGTKAITHPIEGRKTYTLMPLRAPSMPGAWVMVYLPGPE